MIAPPPPCAAIENVLCVAAPLGDTLASQRGIALPHIPRAQHAAAVAALGVEVLDDGGDVLNGAPPPSNALRACERTVCIYYTISRGGGAIAPYCTATLYFPNRRRDVPSQSDRMLQRDIAIRAQSGAAFKAALRATYIVVRQADATTLIPMTKLVPTKEASR